jgi:hypothetical protein
MRRGVHYFSTMERGEVEIGAEILPADQPGVREIDRVVSDGEREAGKR